MQNTNQAPAETRVPDPVPLRDPMVHDLHSRVSKLEQDRNEDRTDLAVMLNDMSYVKKEVTGISRGINRVLWAIGMSVIAAATTFVLSGGLVILE